MIDLNLPDVPARILEKLVEPMAKAGSASANGGKVHEGTRNDYLFRHGCGMRSRGLSEPEIRAELHRENERHCEPPLSAHEFETIIGSVMKYAAGGTGAGPSDEGAAFLDSDNANAYRIAGAFRGELRWSEGLGWFASSGQRWERSEAQAFGVAKGVGRIVKLEAVKLERQAANHADPAEREKLEKIAKARRDWGRQSEQTPRINHAMRAARSLLSVRVEDLDADPWLFNCANGTVDLRTGELREHRREDLITRISLIAYDPSAKAMLWREFLERILPDEFVRRFVQRALGYSLTGLTVEQVILILWGSGQNGKTTLIETILALVGDYGLRTPAETLLARRDSGIPNDVARLRGARFVAAVETDAGRRLSEVKVKELTGGDTISARFLYGELFDFKPTHKLWLATNHRPGVRGTDDAIWRRIRLIPFEVQIPEADRDRSLAERLRAEAEGILAWAVEGCAEWQRDGLGTPDAVRKATAAYRSDEDVLAAFIEDRCVLGQAVWVASADLYRAYKAWSEREIGGERVLTQRALGLALRERGFDDVRKGTDRARAWVGIGLRSQPKDSEPEEGATT